MPYNDKELGTIFPTRQGDAQGAGAERKMLDKIQDTNGFRTGYRINPDGGYTMVRTRGGNPEFVTATSKKLLDQEMPGTLLDFYSGAATTEKYTDGETTLFTPTAVCASEWGLSTGLWYTSTKLNIPCADEFKYRVATEPPIYNEHEVIKPHYYTGHMRKLVQFLLGVGQSYIPSNYTVDYGKTKPYKLPARVQTMSVENSPNLVHHDYEFNNSHGLLYSADGEPWVVEVSGAGVFAYPLPREFGSRRWSEEAADFSFFVSGTTDATRAIQNEPELLGVLRQFKGIPTGEVPASNLGNWIAAGVAFQLLGAQEMSAFTESGAVSPQLGWAFSYTLPEARVVGHVAVEGPGVNYKKARYCKLAFTLPVTPVVQNSAVVDAYLPTLYANIKDDVALRIKAEYLTEAHVATLKVAADVKEALRAIDVGLTSPTAILTVLAEQPQVAFNARVKVWNPYLQLCVGINGTSTGAPATTESMVSVHYTEGGSLVELKYGGTGAVGPYCDEYDPREEGFGSRAGPTVRTFELGPLHYCTVGFSPATDRVNSIDRRWWGRTKDTTITDQSRTTYSSVFVPEGDRESLVFAKMYTQANTEHKVIGSISGEHADARWYNVMDHRTAGGDPTEGFSELSGCAYAAVPEQQTQIYTPSEYRGAGYVETGEWASNCQFTDSIPQGYWGHSWADNGSSTTYSGASGYFEVVLLSGDNKEIIMSDSEGSLYSKYGIWFALSSPTSDPQTMRTAASCLGPTAAYQCYDDINSGHYKMYGTVLHEALESLNPCYIGWV